MLKILKLTRTGIPGMIGLYAVPGSYTAKCPVGHKVGIETREVLEPGDDFDGPCPLCEAE